MQKPVDETDVTDIMDCDLLFKKDGSLHRSGVETNPLSSESIEDEQSNFVSPNPSNICFSWASNARYANFFSKSFLCKRK